MEANGPYILTIILVLLSFQAISSLYKTKTIPSHCYFYQINIKMLHQSVIYLLNQILYQKRFGSVLVIQLFPHFRF